MKKIKNSENEIFESVSKAALTFGVKPSAISHALSKRSKKSCGHVWSYCEDAPIESPEVKEFVELINTTKGE